MRGALNILFGCLLLTMQVMASLAPHSASATETCRCCACGSPCSVPQNAPAPAPMPLAPQRVGVEAEPVVLPTSAPIEPKLSGFEQFRTPQLNSSVKDIKLALYRRDCALLL
jgi:hypothetical protein